MFLMRFLKRPSARADIITTSVVKANYPPPVGPGRLTNSAGRKRRGWPNRADRGQSMLEVMLFLGALMVLITGVVEIGVAVNAYLNVIQSTREGARFDVATAPESTNCSDSSNADSLAGDISDHTQLVGSSTLDMDSTNTTIIVTRARATIFTSTATISCYYTYTEPALGSDATRFTQASVTTRLNQPSQLAAGFTEFVIVEVFYSYQFFLAPVSIPMYSYTLMPVLGR